MRRAISAAVLIASLTAGEALAQSAATIAGTVTTKSDGLSVPGAEVSIPSLGVKAITDAAGNFVLVLPPGTAAGQVVELHVTFEGLQPHTSRVKLEPGALTVDVGLVVSFAEEITVGSRAPGVAAQQAVPVDIITADVIRATGFSETTQIIQAVAPSFNFPRPTITDGTDTVRPATLRGLGPDQVLVLVNGKRRHSSALVHVNGSVGRGSTGVDLNAIPPSAIEKIEILRDGAAAQYGSDAIAGVINIVLKGSTSGGSLSYKVGATTHGDGELNEASGSYGIPLMGGGISISADYRDRNRTNRAGDDPRPQGTDPGVLPPDQPNHRWGDGDTNDLMIFANGQVPLGSGNRFLYAFGGFSRRLGNSGGFYRLANDARNWKAIYPQGFLPQIEPEVIDGSATGGVRGAYKDWFYDASAQWGHNSFEFNVVNSLNASLGPSLANNQTEFYAGTLVLDQALVNVDVSRPWDIGMAGPLNIALGFEFRRENYQILAGEEKSYIDGGVPNQNGGRAAPGAQVFPGFRPSNEVDRSRNNVAGYIDVEGEVARGLRLGGAARVERYSDFGGTADGKVSVRYEPVKQFVVRGAVATGFRAPALQQSYFSAVSTNFLNVGGALVPFEVGTYPVDSPIAKVLGAQALKPEQSRHYSGGIVLAPLAGLQITIDAYRIEIDDRVVFSGNFTGGRITALLEPFGANGARFFTNAINTETTGIDAEAVYTIALDDNGRLRLSGSYNTTDTNIVGQIATPPQLAGLENVLFDRIERRRIECGQPANSLQLAGSWLGQRFGTMARTQRFGKFCSATATVALDQTFSAKWVTDFEANYRFGKFTLQAGVQNAFDVFPDKNIAANSFNGIQTYPGTSPFGMNGRTVFTRLGYSF